MNDLSAIRENYRRICREVARAAAVRGVDPASVTLLGATKTVPPETILYAVRELGLTLIGENRTSELTAKYPYLQGEVEQHFIGHLQTNKVKAVVGRVSLIESVDSDRLAAEIDRVSRARGVVTDILLEVNSAREASKSGFLPEETAAAAERFRQLENIRVRGLMTMGAAGAKSDETRKYFRETYRIFVDIFAEKRHNRIEPILSMGMSDSFGIAVEEGATEIRVGGALFGRRAYPIEGK